MIIHKVRLGEKHYIVTHGGYCYLRGIEITEYKKLIGEHEELTYKEQEGILNARDVEELLGE